MNYQEVADGLGMPAERLERLLGRIVMRSSWPEPQLFRFDKTVSGVEAGTVVFHNGEIVFGYPKIRRAMVLKPALKKHFSNHVVVEEKMNGHNVRVVRIEDRVVALTRGGFICPYSTEVAREQIPPQMFEDHPDLVLCGEMVGPRNPYVPKEVYPVESMDFYLFDASRKAHKVMLKFSETLHLAEEYGVRTVPLLGKFKVEEAYKEIKEIVRLLGKQGREGVVLKDPQNEVLPIKYTSSQSNCADLQFAFRYYNDYGQDFFFSRVVREGFQAVEWGDSEEKFRERCLRLGLSLLAPMRETIEAKLEGERVVQQVQIKVKDLQTARDFERHLRRLGVRAVFGRPQPHGEGYLVRIDRLYMSTNDKTQSLLEGQLW